MNLFSVALCAFIWVVRIDGAIAEETKALCPISSWVDFTNDSSNIYPLQIYDKDLFLKNGTGLTKSCSDFDLSGEPRYKDKHEIKKDYLCPLSFSTCPVKLSNVYYNQKKNFDWQKSTSLCAVKESLNNKTETINVLTFGNSITAGAMAHGCCSNSECGTTFFQKGYADTTKLCAWSRHFSRWIKSISKAKVNYHNLATGGHRSYNTLNDLHTLMEGTNIRQLNSNDIIFLDHGVTDNIDAVNEVEAHTFLTATLTDLILKIYSYCVDKQRLPTIILLEMEQRGNIKPNNNYLISDIYTKVAKQFHIYLWSYRDAVQLGNEHNVKSPNYLSYTPLLEFRDPNRVEHHPAWHIQLYYADLLAATFLQEFSKCGNNTQYNISTSQQMKDNGEYLQSLESKSGLLECKSQVFPLLDMSFNALTNHKPVIGSWNSSNGAWQLTTDVKGKGGFIRQLNRGELPVFYDDSVISFHLNTTNDSKWNSISGIHSNDNTQYILSLTYLASYVNVGVVDIYLCGHFVATIDAMWSDIDKKVSLPEVKHIILDKKMCEKPQILQLKATNTAQGNHNRIMTVSENKVFAAHHPTTHHTTPTVVNKVIALNNVIELVHKIQQPANQRDSVEEIMERGPRFQQMFRLIDIKVCEKASR